MSGNIAGLVEMLFVLGVAVAVGLAELRALRREKSGTPPSDPNAGADSTPRASAAHDREASARNQQR